MNKNASVGAGQVFWVAMAVWMALPGAPAAARAGFDYGDFNALLRYAVGPAQVDGIAFAAVDYGGIRKDLSLLDRTVKALAVFDPAGLGSKAERLAFWINAYNVGAIRLVVDHPDIKSINDIDKPPKSVWKRPALVVGGEYLSLDDIEHQKIRPEGDPRIHFAIVCASLSCPDLRAEIYQAKRLDQQLDEQTRLFLSNPKKGFAIVDGKLKLSKIFEWFEKDFGGRAGVVEYLVKHLPAALQPDKLDADQIDYLPYRWELNTGYQQ